MFYSNVIISADQSCLSFKKINRGCFISQLQWDMIIIFFSSSQGGIYLMWKTYIKKKIEECVHCPNLPSAVAIDIVHETI